MKPILTRDNKKAWRVFCNRLSGKEGCNFKGKDVKSMTWRCNNRMSRPFASKILKSMGFNVAGTLRYFEKHGGYCDCEILFNVDR